MLDTFAHCLESRFTDIRVSETQSTLHVPCTHCSSVTSYYFTVSVSPSRTFSYSPAWDFIHGELRGKPTKTCYMGLRISETGQLPAKLRADCPDIFMRSCGQSYHSDAEDKATCCYQVQWGCTSTLSHQSLWKAWPTQLLGMPFKQLRHLTCLLRGWVMASHFVSAC